MNWIDEQKVHPWKGADSELARLHRKRRREEEEEAKILELFDGR